MAATMAAMKNRTKGFLFTGYLESRAELQIPRFARDDNSNKVLLT